MVSALLYQSYALSAGGYLGDLTIGLTVASVKVLTLPGNAVRDETALS